MSCRKRTVRPKLRSVSSHPFTDSLRYRVDGEIDPTRVPLANVVVDYVTSPTGYTAILFNLRITKNKVFIENTTIYSNEENVKLYKSHDFVKTITYMRDGQFIEMIEKLPSVRVIMPTTPVEVWLRELVLWKKLNLESEKCLQYGFENNKFPKRFYPANLTNSNYLQVRSDVLKHCKIKDNTGASGAGHYSFSTSQMKEFNQQSMVEYQAIIKKYTYKKRLYELCKSYNKELV